MSGLTINRSGELPGRSTRYHALPPAFQRGWAEVPSLGVRLLCDTLRDYGTSPLPLLEAAGLPVGVLAGKERQVTWEQDVRFQRAFAEVTTPEIWVEAGRRFRCPVFNEFGLAMITAPTICHWRTLVTTQHTFYSLGEYRIFDPGAGFAGVEMRLPADLDSEDPLFSFTVWRDVAASVAVLNELWQGRFPFARIEIPSAVAKCPIDDTNIHWVPGDVGVVRWTWPKRYSDHPLQFGNPVIHAWQTDRAQRSEDWLPSSSSLSEQVAAILDKPGQSGSSLQQVAAELTISPRTLQRKLVDECDISFRELRDEARLREAQRLLLKTKVPVSRIAYQLGYAEVASFSNAFRRWTGATPTTFRAGNASSTHDRNRTSC